jgi:glycosyltransferase involved in cell wall biosynthesis
MDRIITVSHKSAEEISLAFKIPQRKLRVVHNGVDTDIFRRKDSVLKQPNSLIVIDGENQAKGVRYLLQAMQLLKDEIEVKLTVVSEGPPNGLYVPSLVNEYGLQDRVTFTGRVDAEELARHYTAAEVAVVPSLYEGFGFPAAEAMSCGLPVIATKAGALPEVVGDDGESGILVPPAEPDALAASIKHLLTNKLLREKMGQAGRKRVERNFSWKQAAKSIVEVYQELL